MIDPMRISLIAPLAKAKAAPPSGDRTVLAELIRALELAGHEVEFERTLRTYARKPSEHVVLKFAANAHAQRLIRKLARTPPDLVLCYHNYYRAPDWIGPRVAAAIRRPYVVVEASHAAKRLSGEWAASAADALAALQSAAAVFTMTPRDRAGLAKIVPPDRLHDLPPFLDARPFKPWRDKRDTARASLASRLNAGLSSPVIAACAMMREGKKHESYRQLFAALEHLRDVPWTLLIAGDGPLRGEIESMAATFAPRVHFMGELAPDAIPEFFSSCDLHLWPGLNEAYGMVYLEAAAAARPSLAYRSGGVASVLRAGETGVLVPEGDVPALGTALRALLADPAARERLGQSAAEFVDRERTTAHAAAILRPVLEKVTRL